MRRSYGPRSLLRVSIVLMVLAFLGTQVTGCGQRGPLYLPDKENPDKRR